MLIWANCTSLDSFTALTLDKGALAPILVDINAILATAYGQTLLLVDQTLDVILLSVDGTTVLEISEVAVLVANFITVSSSSYSAFEVTPKYHISVCCGGSLHSCRHCQL